MDMLSIGSISNYTKILQQKTTAQMRAQSPGQSLFEQREEAGIYDKIAEFSPERASFQRQIDRMNSENSILDRLSGEAGSMESIMAKMQTGQPLSEKELEKLRETDPQAYAKAVQIAAERAAYERRLRQCRTREEAEQLRLNQLSSSMTSVNSIANNPNIPENKKLEMIQLESARLAAINKTHAEFVESGEYAALPEEAELAAAERAELSGGAAAENAPAEDIPEEPAAEYAPDPGTSDTASPSGSAAKGTAAAPNASAAAEARPDTPQRADVARAHAAYRQHAKKPEVKRS